MMEPEILMLSVPDLDATSISYTTGWERWVREKLPWTNHQQNKWREISCQKQKKGQDENFYPGNLLLCTIY